MGPFLTAFFYYSNDGNSRKPKEAQFLEGFTDSIGARGQGMPSYHQPMPTQALYRLSPVEGPTNDGGYQPSLLAVQSRDTISLVCTWRFSVELHTPRILQDDYETVAFVGLNCEPFADASKVTFFHRSHHPILLNNGRADDNYTDIVGVGRAVSKTILFETPGHLIAGPRLSILVHERLSV